MGHDDTLAPQHDVDPPPYGNCKQLPAGQGIAEAAAFAGHGPHGLPQGCLVGTHTSGAHAGAIDAQRLTRPTLAHPLRDTGMSHGFAPCIGRHNLFELTSLRIAVSSICSASSFFSRAFQSSGNRSTGSISDPPHTSSAERGAGPVLGMSGGDEGSPCLAHAPTAAPAGRRTREALSSARSDAAIAMAASGARRRMWSTSRSCSFNASRGRRPRSALTRRQ